MRAKALILAGLALCGIGFATGCHDDCEEVHTTHYYHHHEDRPRVHVRNRFVDVRVGHRYDWHPVRVHVNRDCD